MCDAAFWMDNFNKLGLPLVLLGLVVYSVIAMFKWAGPRIDKWLDEYFTIQSRKATALEESANKCTQLQQENLTMLRELTVLLHSMSGALTAVRKD